MRQEIEYIAKKRARYVRGHGAAQVRKGGGREREKVRGDGERVEGRRAEKT